MRFLKIGLPSYLSNKITAFLLLSLLIFASNAMAQEEFYTIMVGSYHSLENAESDYKAMEQSLMKNLLGTLRIEQNGQYYTVRLGKFLNKEMADGILPEVRQRFKDARVLSAFYKPERIVKILSETSNVSLAAKAVVVTNTPAEHSQQVEDPNNELRGGVPHAIKMIKGRSLKKDIYAVQTVIDPDLYEGLQDREFYTLQTGSFVSRDLAWLEFDRLRHKKNIDLDWLRIEKINRFFTVRIGKFNDEKDGRLTEKKIKKQINAKLMQVYIKPERILKIYAVDASKSTPVKEVVSLPSAEPPKQVRVISSGKYKVEIVDHISGMQAESKKNVGNEEFFTVQAASFNEKKLAFVEFNNLQNKFSDELPELRIETVNGYFTVRFGRFKNKQEAMDAAAIITEIYPHVIVLQAYIIDSRIIATTNRSEIKEPVVRPLEETKNREEPEELKSPVQEVVEDEPIDNNEVEVAEKTVVKPEKAKKISKIEPTQVGGDDLGDVFDNNDEEKKISHEVVKIIDTDDQGEKIKMPSALFFDRNRDELYVINGVNNRIIVYGPDFFPQNSLGKGRGIDSPMGGYIAPDGKIYIAQAGLTGSAPRITILNNAFMPEKEIMMSDMPDSSKFIPQKITEANEKLYITGLHAKRILILGADGHFIKWFAVAIDKRGNYAFSDLDDSHEKTYIRDVASDYLGNFFLLSEETSKIYVFNANDDFLYSFGVKGGAEGKMSRPRGLAIDEKKHCIYVVDYMRHTVLVYDFAGKFRFEFGGRGWGDEWFNYPADIELGAQGRVIVADFFNQKVKVFSTHWQEEFPARDPKLWQLTEGDKSQ